MGETKTAGNLLDSDTLFSEINQASRVKKNRSRKWLWVVGVIAIIAALGAFGVVRYKNRARNVAYVTTPAVRANVDDTVDATGTINAVTTVQVGAQVSGLISQLYADFNSTVAQGELLAVIDPRVYEGQLLQAQANLANAQANLAATKANLVNAQAKAVQAKADYERASDLTTQGIMSPQSFDAAKAAAASAALRVAATLASPARLAAAAASSDFAAAMDFRTCR